MKYDIEVVGERCRRKDEPKPSPADPDDSGPAHGPPSIYSPDQPPATPEDGRPRNGGKDKRTSVGSQGHPTASSWRHVTYHARQGSGGRVAFEDRGMVSRGQSAMKVRISYVDNQGRVNSSPKSARGRRPVTTPGRGTDSGDPTHPEHTHGLSGWGSSVSITSLVDRLYRPKTSAPSTRDKIFGSVLDKHFVDSQHHGSCHSQFSDVGTEEELLFNTSSSAVSMPTIPSSRPQLTASTPCTTPPSPILQTTSPCDGDSGVGVAMKNSHSHTSKTSTTSSKAAVRSHVDKSHSVLNGIHANGRGPSASAIMNGAQANRNGSTISATVNKGAKSSPDGGPPRPVNIPGKRVQFSVADTMKERLRNMYAYRRVHSAAAAAAAAASGGWSGPSGSVAMAYGRLRNRRKTTIHQPAEVAGDENAPPPVSRMFRKFRMVGFITMNLIRLKAAIVVNSLDRTERSAAEIQWRTLYGEQEAEKLAFNKSHYSRERITTKMPRWALEIFDILPENRTEHDCRRLHALFRGMRSFDKFTEEIQMNLCRAFSYACVEESRIVLRRGHIGHNFYFIYSGSVFVNVQDKDSTGEPFIKTEAILARGDSFGELALLKDIRRTATVSVRETCELLVVDKDVFSQVCPKIFENELLEKKNFISHMSLFSPKFWSADSLSSLCMEAQIQEYKINKIVVENNTTEEWLYICMEGKCQVIRCLSEEGEEEEESLQRGQDQSLILSEEIIELLASTRDPSDDREEEEETENSKEMLLSSLGLEYVQTGKRSGAFLEEVEEEERRKAFMTAHGPMTLTSLMTKKEKEGKTGLVYIKVGTLESEDVFDISSLINAPAPRTHSALLLVSCGARMLRLKKSLFSRLASAQAMEHTRTLVSKHPFPTETAILESYKRKVDWTAYKAKVVKNVITLRDLRNAPLYRDDRKKTVERERNAASKQRARSSKRLPTALKSSETKLATSEDSLTTVEDKKDAAEGSDGQNGLPTVTESNEENGSEFTGSDGEDPPQAPIRIFPVVEVDTKVDPDTPRPDSSSSSSEDLAYRDTGPSVIPVAMQYGVGPAPEAVIIHRRSSIGSSCRPQVSVDTTFVTRRRRSREETSSNQVTRFNVASDLDTTTVAEQASEAV